MAHPALVAVMLGLGVAAFIIYMFTDGEGQQESPQTNCDGGAGLRSNYSDSSWNSGSSRRRRSSARCEDCSICLNDLRGYTMVCLQPCRHYFHEMCINEWQLRSSGVGSCPNCREVIQEKVQVII